MLVQITWQTIALRIVLTILAGALLGLNRSKHGNPAGLRTTLLVTLAASIAMIQMNLLLSTNGKPHDSYAVMDMMRLPLGILTGVGFIGAGAILRKDTMVIGVTTAATMWFATVVGLCLGGGQVILGSVSAVIGFLVLSSLHWAETKLEEHQQATLKITIAENKITEAELRTLLESGRVSVRSVSVVHCRQEHQERFECNVRWPAHKDTKVNPAVLEEIDKLPGLIEMSWVSAGAPLT
jgi:putative Mg2+ transporter-C (MgtC) family protein